MSAESELREKLRKVEALLARPGTPGEQQAAKTAHDRILERLSELERESDLREFRCSIHNPYSRALFAAVCRTHRVETRRYARQRRTTIIFLTTNPTARALWSEYAGLNRELRAELERVTDQFVRERVQAT